MSNIKYHVVLKADDYQIKQSDGTYQSIVGSATSITLNSLYVTKQNIMASATIIPSSGLTDNTKYFLGEITSLDLTSMPTSNYNGILIYFSTGTGGCTLTYPANTKWYGDSAPSIAASKSYTILIADNICGIKEYNPMTQS